MFIKNKIQKDYCVEIYSGDVGSRQIEKLQQTTNSACRRSYRWAGVEVKGRLCLMRHGAQKTHEK